MYLVTGGAGFIGSRIAARLAATGERVRVLDNLSFGSGENLTGFDGRIDVMSGDVTNPSVVRRAMSGINVVFHEAALRSVGLSLENPGLVNRVNVEGTLNVLLAARDAGVRRVVYASSCLVYGNTETVPQREDLTPCPTSPYAVSKLAGEYYCKVFADLYGLETVTLRYFDVFGPRQEPDAPHAAVIARFIAAAVRGEPLQIHGDGLQTRDFTYIDNIVDANLLAAESMEAVGEVFNIGQNGSFTLLDVIDLLRRIVGRQVCWSHAQARAGDVRHSRADISKAKRLLDYHPRISFAEGLKRTVDDFRKRSAATPGANGRSHPGQGIVEI